MVKLLAAVLLIAMSAMAQVSIETKVTAVAGPITCTGTITSSVANTLHMTCFTSTDTFVDTNFKVPSVGAVMYSISIGSDTVTWLLSKGNPTPDRWEVAANGAMKSGTF